MENDLPKWKLMKGQKQLPVEELNIDVLESLAEDLLNEKQRNLKENVFSRQIKQ